MIYPKTFETKIGFDKIKKQINDICLTSGGKVLVNNINFSDDFDEVVRLLSETDEIRQAVLFHSAFHFSEFPDCIHEILRISVEGTIIDEQTLSDLDFELSVFEDCISFFQKRKEKFPLINQLWSHDFNSSKLIADINKIVDEKGEIKDNASDKLLVIRQKISHEQRHADKQIALIMKSAKTDGIVKDDSEISIRNGRTVIPVPAANKRLLKGFVHDSSATGQTLYIEPDVIFEINNEISELRSEEKHEIIRILKDFTVRLRPDIPLIIDMNNYLSYIDFLRAKAYYAINIKGVKPIVSNIPNINLIRAKHPILLQSLEKQNRTIVPLNIVLNEDNRIVVISGPNAGGKSIALKTVALLQYMLQCGLLISVSENSEIGIFHNIFIDIGDEQSIENDLSTYTSHLKNLKCFVENANQSSLILIDELGTGTEPQLGGAIAEAVLERLCQLGTKGIITTHYSNIKKLANEKAGLTNAAMLFDKKEMQPLFQLSVGKPGSSYTLEIAHRVGFPNDILDVAKSKSNSSSQINYDKLLEELEIEKLNLAKEKEELNVADEFLKEVIDKYTTQLRLIEDSKKDIIKKAKAEAADIVRNTNRKIETAIKEIREAQAQKEKTKRIREQLELNLKKSIENTENQNANNIKLIPSTDSDNPLNQDFKIPSKIRKKLDEINNSKLTADKQLKNTKIDTINEDKSIIDSVNKFEKLKNDFPDKEIIYPQKKKNIPEKLGIGCLVTAYDSETVGEIAEIDGQKAKVLFGSMAMTVNLKDLRIHQGERPKERSYYSEESVNSIVKELSVRAFNFNLCLDVRGLRAEEAMFELTHYVDDAIMLSIHNFSVLHGRGNGILRKKIREYLSTIKQVTYFGDESIHNGGDGVTVVRLDFSDNAVQSDEKE